MDLSNVFNTGGMVTGIGMLIVFICLIALIIIMVVLPKVINTRTGKKKKPDTPAGAVKASPAPGGQEPAARPHTDDSELVAVLAAAVTAMLGTRPEGIVVRSYRRISPSAWKKSGRDYQFFHKI